MSIFKVAPLAVLAALASACVQQTVTPPRPDEAAIKAGISAQLAKFGPAMAAKDAAGVASLFTEDGTWILPDASTFNGRNNIEAGAKNFFTTMESLVPGETAIDKLIVVSDAEAVTFSHGDYTQTEKGKPPAQHMNPFADHWKKGADGTWLIAYEINADGPGPASAAMKP